MYFSKPNFLPSLKGLSYNSTNTFVSLFCTLSSITQVLNQEILPIDEFIKAFGKTRSSHLEKRLARVRSPDVPISVLKFLQNLRFSESQIISIVRSNPQILCSNVKKSLNPKVEFFQQLGLVGSDLGKFFSRHPGLLTASLEKSLVPGINNLERMFNLKDDREGLIELLHRCGSVCRRPPESGFLRNVAFFESCGIDWSQIAMLIRRQPRLFVSSQQVLRDLVTRAKDMGAALNSRMFIHAIHSLSSVSAETFRRKRELFFSFRFSNVEIMHMFTTAPTLLRTSEDKLNLGLEFFLHTMEVNKSILVRTPNLLMYNIEKRIIPRYNVLLLLKEKKLLRKEPKLTSIMTTTEDQFMQKFILPFDKDIVDLLMAYKGQYLDATSDEESPPRFRETKILEVHDVESKIVVD